jgi:hypothetical protein
LKALQTIAGVKTGQEFLEANFIWDELIAMYYDGVGFNKTPKNCSRMPANDQKAVKDYSVNKLKKELNLGEPKYAIFLIGEYYNELNDFFNLNWEITPIGNKLTLTAAERYPEKNVQRNIQPQLINEFWIGEIHCFATSHPDRPIKPEYKEIEGVKTKVVEWDPVIAKKVWEFLAQEIKK